MTNSGLLDSEKAAIAALSALPTDAGAYDQLSEAEILKVGELSGLIQRLASTHGALIAGSVARRSAPELGGLGLAQKLGERTPINLLKSITGITGREAATAIRVARTGSSSISFSMMT